MTRSPSLCHGIKNGSHVVQEAKIGKGLECLPSTYFPSGYCSSKVIGGKKGLNKNAERKKKKSQDEQKVERLNVTNFPYRKRLHF